MCQTQEIIITLSSYNSVYEHKKNICMPQYQIVQNVLLSMTVVNGLLVRVIFQYISCQTVTHHLERKIFNVKFRDSGFG